MTQGLVDGKIGGRLDEGGSQSKGKSDEERKTKARSKNPNGGRMGSLYNLREVGWANETNTLPSTS